MNLYRCTVAKRDGSSEPKVIYLLADNPGDAEILACIDAGLSGTELSLHSTNVEEAAIPERCTSNLDPYLAWHEKAGKFAEAGEVQMLSALCKLWKWPDEHCEMFIRET